MKRSLFNHSNILVRSNRHLILLHFIQNISSIGLSLLKYTTNAQMSFHWYKKKIAVRKWTESWLNGKLRRVFRYKKIAKEHKSPLILAVCLNGWLLHEWSNWQHCRYHPTINQRASTMPNEANKQCAWWEVVGIEWNPYSAIAMRWLWYFDRNDALYVITHHKLHLFNILHSIRFMYLAFGVFP